jgi:CarD family transcriptional regulator, regulator of rRNA transcription
MSLRSARARTARPASVKSTRKSAKSVVRAARPSAPAPRPRPVSTPPSGRPKAAAAPAAVTVPKAPRAPTVLPSVPRPPIPSVAPTKAQFKLGDKAVHPKHGVGEVTAIDERELGGTRAVFYVLRILDNGMKVMVPANAAAAGALRGIMSSKEADAVLDTMRAREVAVDVQPWSRRFRAYTEMVQSGSPHEVAKVLRDMHRLKFDKDLSFGERHLLDRAKSLLMKELAFAKKVTEEKLAEEVASIFQA